MKIDFKRWVRDFGAGLIGALLAILAGWALNSGYFKFVDYDSYNILIARRDPIDVLNDAAVLVLMDDGSHEQLHQSYSAAWNRHLHARLLELMTQYKARAVVFDIVFSDAIPSNPDGDQHFAQAIKDNGHVILAADYNRSAAQGVDRSASVMTINPPYELFGDAAANIGVDEMIPDEDFVVRSIFPGNKDSLVSTLSWTTAELLKIPVAQSEKNKFADRWVNYYGPPHWLPHYSFAQVLSTNVDRVPASAFSNKVVFVGAALRTQFAGQRKDEYVNPYSAYERIKTELARIRQRLLGHRPNYYGNEQEFSPGVELQATEFLNLSRGDWLKTPTKRSSNRWVVVVGLVLGLGLIQLRPIYATVAAIAAFAGGFWFTNHLFVTRQIWLPWLVLAGQIPVAWIWSVSYNSVKSLIEINLLNQSLSMYLSPKRAKQIRSRTMLEQGAERKEVTILFTDVANFTAMSEGMDSTELQHVMNDYFERAVTGCIDPVDGCVIKYIGDAIFALWNAPDPQKHHQELACRAAIMLAERAVITVATKPGLDVRTRIGLHCGTADVGNFGSKRRVDYTAFGENVNLASRMEGLNKYLGTTVLITGAIEAEVRGKFVTRFAGRFQLKGFAKAVDVHELVALPEAAEASRGWREPFAEGVACFQSGAFDKARACLDRTLEVRPTDGPSKFLLKYLDDMDGVDVSNWNGIVELKEK